MGLLILVGADVVLFAIFTIGAALIAPQLSQGIVSWLKDAGRVGQLLGGVTAEISVRLSRYITHKVGAVWADAERLMVAWFSGLYQWLSLAIGQALVWPITLYKFQTWLLWHGIPDAIRAALRGVHGAVTTVTKVLPTVTHTIVRLPKLTKAQAKALLAASIGKIVLPYAPSLRWLRAHLHALQAVIAHAPAIPRFPSLSGILKRLKRLEKVTAVGVGVGLVAAALSRLGLGWIRCNNVKRAGRSVCGMDFNLLDSLLLDSLAIFGVISVVEFANGLRTIEDEAVTILRHGIREFPG